MPLDHDPFSGCRHDLTASRVMVEGDTGAPIQAVEFRCDACRTRELVDAGLFEYSDGVPLQQLGEALPGIVERCNQRRRAFA